MADSQAPRKANASGSKARALPWTRQGEPPWTCLFKEGRDDKDRKVAFAPALVGKANSAIPTRQAHISQVETAGDHACGSTQSINTPAARCRSASRRTQPGQQDDAAIRFINDPDATIEAVPLA